MTAGRVVSAQGTNAPERIGFLRFWARALKRAPGVVVRAANGAVAIIGVLLVVVALVNRPLARELASWQGFSPLWALLPFVCLVAYGLARAVHDEFVAVEEQRDAACRERDAARDRIGELEGLKPEPKLRFAQPVLAECFFNETFAQWRGYVVRFQVANDPDAPDLAMDAQHVWAELTIRDLKGAMVYPPVVARWSETELPKAGGPTVPSLTIAANGLPHALDSVAQAADEYEMCWVCNDESLRLGVKQNKYRLHGKQFVLEMKVRGHNVGEVVQRVGVKLGFPHPTMKVLD
jgi:hypothetical protein